MLFFEEKQQVITSQTSCDVHKQDHDILFQFQYFNEIQHEIINPSFVEMN